MATIKLKRNASYGGIVCPQCKRALNLGELSSGMQTCMFCRKEFEAARFDPPQIGALRVKQFGEAAPGGAVPCANHERNTAVAGCERCGCFLCGLCKIDTDGMVLCPACFERLSAEGALPSAVRRISNYGGIAATIALLGIFMFYLGLILGPLAIYYALKARKDKRQRGESDGGFFIWTALILGVLETLGGIFLLLILFKVFK